MSLVDDDGLSEAYVVLVFRGARTTSDRFIRFCTGEEVHVDIGVFDAMRQDWDENFAVYSAYVGCDLDKTEIHGNYYTPENGLDKVYAIRTTPKAAGVTAEFLQKLVEQPTPYNHLDLALCAMPERFVKRLPDTELHNVTSVFCSQLVILALRVMLIEDRATPGLTQAMHDCNSRTISPARLASILRPFMTRVDLRAYLKGSIDMVRF